MRYRVRTLLVILVASGAVPAMGSAFTLTVRHEVLVTDDAQKKLVRVVFEDERLLADLERDVFAADRDFPVVNEKTWLRPVRWSLVSKEGGPVPLPDPVVRSNVKRKRRDTSVPVTTYNARLDFGSIPAGEYILTATNGELRSEFRFTVATGREPGLRDHYLRLKARTTRDFAEFRSWQLERLKANPDRLDVLYAIIDRSLFDASLQETRWWFQRVLAVAEKNRKTTSDPALAIKIANDIQQLRRTVTALPLYYSCRDEWSMTRDGKTGHYVIRKRRGGAVIRDFSRER